MLLSAVGFNIYISVFRLKIQRGVVRLITYIRQ
jgi:hypothetical protein